MTRTLIAIVAGAVAVGVLAIVATQSRSVSAQVHIAQNSVSADAAFVSDDFRTLVNTLQSAWDAGQLPGEAARRLATRIAEWPERMREVVFAVPGSSGQEAIIRNLFARFTTAIDVSSAVAQQLLVDQSVYGESVAIVRNNGPRLTQALRDRGFGRAAADARDLVAETIRFTEDPESADETGMHRYMATLARERRLNGNVPNGIEELNAAVETILALRPLINTKLSQLAITEVPETAQNLDDAIQNVYQSNVARADSARWFLAMYALALLGAVGYFGFRLKQSYKQINAANAELAGLNASLEQRVKERTEELEGTLADLKESQVQLVQAEKMSSLGQLVAGISHEINTPLLYLANNVILIRERLEQLRPFMQQSMSAFTLRSRDFESRTDYQRQFAGALNALRDMLRHDSLDVEIEEAIDLIQDCDEGLKDLTEIAQSLKDFSRLDRAPVGNFDVNTGLDKTLLIAKNMVKHKADVIKNYENLPEIACSPSQINQVFLNLISNATQAIKDKGQITLTTKRYDDDHVAVSITDTGTGIPREIIDKIRDPFFTTKDVGSGTGLGLSIVDEIVRNHGGKLLIESEVGIGSTFTVVLPIEEHKPAQAEKRNASTLAGKPSRNATGNLAKAS